MIVFILVGTELAIVESTDNGSMHSVAPVRHADTPVFQAVFSVELVAAIMVAFENSIYSAWRFDLRYCNSIMI